jgi:hypothetical protein
MSENGTPGPDERPPPGTDPATSQRMLTPSGAEWLEKFSEAHALVVANTVFLTFMLGQAGVAMEVDKPAARTMLGQIQQDIDDLRESVLNLADVSDNMIANAARNLDAAEEGEADGTDTAPADGPG